MIGSHRVSLRKHFWLLLEQCKNMRELKQIHCQILLCPKLPSDDRYFLISRLLFFSATSKSGSLWYATDVFHHIKNPNLFVYNAMIRAHASLVNGATNNSSFKTLYLYKQMLQEGIQPNHLTFPFLVKECTNQANVQLGRSVHTGIVKIGFEKDVIIHNSIILMYSTCGDLEGAHRVFDEMPVKDIVSWNSLLIGYLRCGALELALDLFRSMKERNIITWNSIVTGMVQGGRPKEALEFFHEMLMLGDDRARPDKRTIASVVSACASLGAIDQGKWVHGYMQRNGIEYDTVIRTALVDMYGKCGCVERAFEVFKEIKGKKDVLAWTAMISVFALHGLVHEAFDLFEDMRMQGTKPNQVTFVGLLSACAHSGLVEKGRWVFDMMQQVYSFTPQAEHCACMVDILGRAGLFEEAEKFIRSMPMKPDVFVWGALLGSCRMYGNVDLGEKVVHHLIEFEPLNHAFYVILSDIYAKANRFVDVKRIRASMEDRGIKKPIPGCSLIEIDGVVHEFSVRGSPETKMKEIERVLTGVSDEMKIVGNCLTIDTELIDTEEWG